MSMSEFAGEVRMEASGVGDMRATMRRASRLLRAMANERRLLILSHLLDGEKSVGELQKLVDISQSALSQHLARLRAEKLVVTRREAQNIYYAVEEPIIGELLALLRGRLEREAA
jgi:ArsR family transcriptional regulator, virulence genes transcriptional regulator